MSFAPASACFQWNQMNRACGGTEFTELFLPVKGFAEQDLVARIGMMAVIRTFRRPQDEALTPLRRIFAAAPGPFIGTAKSFSSAVFGTAYRITEDSALSLVAGSSDFGK